MRASVKEMGWDDEGGRRGAGLEELWERDWVSGEEC